MRDVNQSSIIVSPQRRQLLKLGALTGAAGIFSAVATGGQKAEARGRRNPEKDVELFNGAIMLEQKAINTYVAAAENYLLPTQAFLDVAVQFAGDHTNHRDRLKQIVSDVFKAEPVGTDDLGTFPIPQNVLTGGEAEVIRYALNLEMLASKAYLDYILNQLTTDEAVNVAATIMPVETMHVAVFRSVLMVVLNERGLPGDDKLVPNSFLTGELTPPVPTA